MRVIACIQDGYTQVEGFGLLIVGIFGIAGEDLVGQFRESGSR